MKFYNNLDDLFLSTLRTQLQSHFKRSCVKKYPTRDLRRNYDVILKCRFTLKIKTQTGPKHDCITVATIGADGMKFGVSDCSITPVRNAEFHTTGPVAAEFTRYESGVDFCVWGVYMIVCIVGGWPWSCRTETETISRMEKAGPFNYCCSHQSVASPSLCLCQGSRWTFCDGFMVQCVKLMLSEFLHLWFLLSDCFVYRRNLTCLKRCTRYGHYAGEVEDIIKARLAIVS